MKKRIISMLLTVLMVLSLFSGMTVGAYADTINGAKTVNYTMGQGDFVLRICQKLGLNYYTCKQAIMALNGIQDGQWNKLAVGTTLTLPASDYDALLISNAKTTTYNAGVPTTTATSSTVTGTATTTSTAASTNKATTASADTLAYYLVPYTMSYGETVSGVCNALGVNFSIFSPFIKQVNNITNWNKVRAGDTLIIPTPVAPAVGTTCYGVMLHTVASSDTAYGIVNSKGVNYNANERLLKVLNQTDNLAAIKAGDKFFYPVPLTVSVPGTGNPGSTATTTTTTTVTDGNGTTTTSTTTTSKLYKLSSGMAASDGTMLFYVDSKAVTAAPAGAKVTIVSSTNSGKAIQDLTVKHADGTADLHLSGDAFVMPGCDVRVDAVIKNGHNINIAANYSGKASASVGGISVQSAVKGATVVIRSVDPNYEITSVYATYKKMVSASNKTQLTVSASKAFVMPDGDVDVEVVLKPVSTYAFYVTDSANGSYYLEVNGSPATRAAKGATVTVVAKPDNGYQASNLTVKNHTTGANVSVFSNTFTMPAFDVDVEVTFAGKGNNILIMPSQFGNVYAFDSNSITDASEFVTEADTGTTVYLVAVNEDGAAPAGLTSANYNIEYDIVRNSDGLKVKGEFINDSWPMKVDGTDTTSGYYTFTMPKGGVTITPVITATNKKDIYAKFFVNNTAVAAGTYKDCSFTITWNGKTTTFTETLQQISKLKGIRSLIPEGEYLDLRYNSADGIAFVKYRIMDGTGSGTDLLEEETNEANRYGYFKMPGKNIEIEVYFETDRVAIGDAAIEGVGSLGYEIVGVSGGPVASATCAPGSTVRIFPKAGNGYRFDHTKYEAAKKQTPKLVVTRKDNGAVLPLTQGTIAGNTYYEFTMPAEGVNVQAIFDPKPFIITMRCYDEVGTAMTGEGIWQIAINGVVGAVDLNPAGTKVEVAYGDYITVAMTESGWSTYDMYSFRIDNQEYTAEELNYFYNFQMIEERAKDLDIVAVLRPRVTNAPHAHRLIASYLPTMGDVEFILFDENPLTHEKSGTGYAHNVEGVDYYAISTGPDGQGKYTITGARYTSYAFAGDYVGLIANSNDKKYVAKLDNISIIPVLGDANRLVPTPMEVKSINGDNRNYTLYVFRMPDDDLAISVNFTGEKYDISVAVRDANGNPVNGMIDMYVETSVFSDVAADSTFGSVSFNQLVTIMPSTRARTESKLITKVDVKTKADSQPVYYYDNSMAGSGPVFYMPASDVIVYITVDDYQTVNLVNFQYDLDGGTLVARTGPSMTDPIATEFNVGDEIYIFEVPASGRAHLGKGDLSITNNSVTYTVANWHAEAADGTNIWKFKIPAGMTIFTATWPTATTTPAAQNTIYAPTSSIVGGTLEFTQSGNMVADYTTTADLVITAAASAGHDALTAADITIKDVNGNDVPFTLAGTTITIKKEDLPEGGISVSAAFPTKKATVNFKLAAGSAASAKLTLNGIDQLISDTTGKTWDLEPGLTITIRSDNGGYNTVKAHSTYYGTNLEGASLNYVVPTGNDTVEITLTSNNPAVKLNTVTNGSVNLRKVDDHTAATEAEGNFAIGNDLYIQLLPAYGYELEKLEVKNTGTGAAVTTTTAPISGDQKVSSIPVGGVTVTVTFRPKTVTLNFTPSITGAVASVVANVNTGNGINGSGTTAVSATYGRTIEVTPAAGYEWSSAAMTVTAGGNPVTVSGSGNTGARSFEITNEGPYTITLGLVHVD